MKYFKRRKRRNENVDEPCVVTSLYTDDPTSLPVAGKTISRTDGDFFVTDVRLSVHQQAQAGSSFRRYEVVGCRVD